MCRLEGNKAHQPLLEPLPTAVKAPLRPQNGAGQYTGVNAPEACAELGVGDAQGGQTLVYMVHKVRIFSGSSIFL